MPSHHALKRPKLQAFYLQGERSYQFTGLLFICVICAYDNAAAHIFYMSEFGKNICEYIQILSKWHFLVIENVTYMTDNAV